MRTPAAAALRSREERDKLIEDYLPLVKYVVARIHVTIPPGLSREDFFSVGVMGLIHAASTYDASRGASFKTFAYTAIRGAILDEVRKHDPVPRGRRERLRKLERASAALHAELGRAPTLEEVAEVLGLEANELDEDLLALHTCRTLSLDEGGEHGGFEPAQPGGGSPDGASERREQIERLARALSELPEADRHVVVLYHYEGLYLKEIGDIVGVSESRVSQILSRAHERLRWKLRETEA